MKFFREEDLNNPVGSEELKDIISGKESELKAKDEFIPCYKNPFHEEMKMRVMNQPVEDIMLDTFILPMLGTPCKFDQEMVSKRLREAFKNPLASVPGVVFNKKRSELDSRLDYSQMVVSVMVRDLTGRILLLKNTDKVDLVDKYSMIQGHCSYSSKVFTTSFETYLMEEAMREFNEEVNFTTKDDTVAPIEVTFLNFISMNATPIDTMHTGFVMCVTVDNFDNYEISSREPEKFSTHVMTTQDLIVARADNMLDSWTYVLLGNGM